MTPTEKLHAQVEGLYQWVGEINQRLKILESKPLGLPGGHQQTLGRIIKAANLMSIEEAKEYVDVVVEALVEMGTITNTAYGMMSENQREELAEKVKKKSEE